MDSNLIILVVQVIAALGVVVSVVYLGIQIRCELYSMLMKYLEIIDIDEPKDNPLTSLEVLENAN